MSVFPGFLLWHMGVNSGNLLVLHDLIHHEEHEGTKDTKDEEPNNLAGRVIGCVMAYSFVIFVSSCSSW